jgi:hypothetical protein
MKRIGFSLLVASLAVAALAETPAERTFAALKKLSGTWVHGKGKDSFKVIYKVTGGGATLIETQFPGMGHEMVTIYHLDGPDKLVLTHYCAAKNQPSMRLLPGATEKEFKFDFVSGTNMKPTDMHIHTVRYRILDKDHIISEWQAYANGKPSLTEKFDLHRAKA